MDKVWQGYIDNTLSLDMSLKDAYCQCYRIPSQWVEIEDITLEEYVQKCTDFLEAAGYNLDTTPLKYLEDKFVSLEITITAPKEYIDLSKSLTAIEKQIDACDVEHMKQQLITIRGEIEAAIRDMK